MQTNSTVLVNLLILSIYDRTCTIRHRPDYFVREQKRKRWSLKSQLYILYIIILRDHIIYMYNAMSEA